MQTLQPALENGQTGPMGRVEGLPQVFGRYLLVQRLSRGGMGEIFLAKHGLSGFEKLAVIKKVLPHLAADAQFISRFVDEAQVAIKLQHVNIAQVFEVGRVGDEYFLALEYVEGRDLRRTLGVLGQRKLRLPVDLALFVGRELANGLAYAHRRTSNDGASLNLVHCDISPPNVLVSFEGETKVIDFGIAKSAIRGTATDPKMGFGKFGYMAPEQLIRGGVVDHRTDIYAAGVVLFELLTGKRLYEAGPEPDYRALAKKVAKGEHMMPSDVDKVLAPYDDLVATALRPKSEDRYQSAAEFRDSIQQCLVSVNPTISTDQLGAYMRDLFSEEMTAQRELHERIAKAHLEDFHDQLTTQTGTTVSFAFANMPLPAPPEVVKPPVLPRTATPQAPVKPRAPTAPTDMLPQQPQQPPPVPTAAIPTQELDLADGTGAAELMPDGLVESIRPNHKRVVALALGAAVLVIGVVVFAMTRTNHESNAATIAKTDPPKQHVTVEELPPEQPIVTPIGSDSKQAEAKADPKTEVAKPETTDVKPDAKTDPKADSKADAKTVKQTHVQVHHQQTHKQTEIAAPKPALTRDAVAAKFSAVKREYDGYKSKNGGRLDGDWGDLAMFVQYHLNDSTLDEVAHRIEGFHAKMKD